MKMVRSRSNQFGRRVWGYPLTSKVEEEADDGATLPNCLTSTGIRSSVPEIWGPDLMPRAPGAWPEGLMRADPNWKKARRVSNRRHSAIKNPQSPDSFFDSPPKLVAPPAGRGRVGYDAFRVERPFDPLKVLPQLVIGELVGLCSNYSAGLRMSSEPLVELHIQCRGFVTRIYDLN